MKNRKGLSQFVTIVVFVIGILLAGAFILGFIIAAQGILPGSVSAKMCRWSLIIKYSWNTNVEKMANSIEDVLDNAGLWGTNWYPGQGIQCAWNLVTGDGWTDTLEEIGDEIEDAILKNLRLGTDRCVENTPVTCKDDAMFDGYCVYKKAVQTFYTLGGGQSEGTKTKFVLFEVDVEVMESSTITLNSSHTTLCADVEDRDTNNDPNNAFEYDGKVGNLCNVTIKKINEDTMTLIMVSVCQEKGPEDTGWCKCFAMEDMGYSEANGLPNNVGFLSSAGYGTPDYYGCGIGSALELGSATLDGNDLITWNAGTITRDTVYMKLSDDAKKVEISTS